MSRLLLARGPEGAGGVPVGGGGSLGVAVGDPGSSLPFAARLRDASAPGAALIAVLSVLALVGWAVHAPVFDRLAPRLPPIKANAAACFLLASVSLLAYSRSWPRSWLRRVGAACATVALLVGAATLAEYLLKWRLGIDQLPVSDTVSEHAPYPGRPAANTAVGFVLLGAGLLLWDVRVRRCWATNVAVLDRGDRLGGCQFFRVS